MPALQSAAEFPPCWALLLAVREDLGSWASQSDHVGAFQIPLWKKDETEVSVVFLPVVPGRLSLEHILQAGHLQANFL